jgi:hypothetical protein
VSIAQATDWPDEKTPAGRNHDQARTQPFGWSRFFDVQSSSSVYLDKGLVHQFCGC